MLNWVVDAECTYAELAERSQQMWDTYVEAPAEDPNESWGGRWRPDAARALAFLRSAEVAVKPVRMICETQLLLRPYLEGRVKMHLLYKVVRAVSSAHLYQDFHVVKTLPKGTTFASWQRDAVVAAQGKLDEDARKEREVIE